VLLVKPEYLDLWFELGILLNVSDKKLQDIKIMQQNDSDLCCTRMFMEWESNLDPTWNKLKTAVNYLNISSIKNTGWQPLFMFVLCFIANVYPFTIIRLSNRTFIC